MKSMNLAFFFSICFFVTNNCIENSTSTTPDLKTSLIIPCCPRHANHLYSLLKEYELQTHLPDEVIISISESKKINSEVIEALRNEQWHFPVKLFLSEKKQFAGENRNIACHHAIGDILICQDADDMPHPQRIEIIKYFFRKYNVDHVMHQFSMPGAGAQNYGFNQFDDFGKIEFAYPRVFNDIWRMYPHNGNIAISKNLFKKIQWSHKPRGQDVEFNVRVYGQIPSQKRLIIKARLLAYRVYLSSLPDFKIK